jgi:secondary thiamine-phosphate synthase enzyme
MITRTVIQTSKKTEVLNVTEQLAGLIGDVAQGLVWFSVPHTTAALILCEDDEELRDDLVRVAERLLADLRPFKHIRKNNPNAEAHIISALAGTSVTLAVENGHLYLGRYQNLLFVEMDGPKEREIHCFVMAANE